MLRRIHYALHPNTPPCAALYCAVLCRSALKEYHQVRNPSFLYPGEGRFLGFNLL